MSDKCHGQGCYSSDSLDARVEASAQVVGALERGHHAHALMDEFGCFAQEALSWSFVVHFCLGQRLCVRGGV